MNQQKIGEFLKRLRKDKGLTQEQLAEHFYVSNRTVSRWETGRNMPDVDMLIELSDFYNVDVREIIDGGRKSENMDNETKETIKKVAEYATEENNRRTERFRIALLGSTCLMFICYMLFASWHVGRLYGIVPENICSGIISFSCGLDAAVLVLYAVQSLGLFNKISRWKRKRRENKH